MELNMMAFVQGIMLLMSQIGGTATSDMQLPDIDNIMETQQSYCNEECTTCEDYLDMEHKWKMQECDMDTFLVCIRSLKKHSHEFSRLDKETKTCN